MSSAKKVLLIEDDPRLRAVALASLSGRGLLVTAVGNARDALVRLGEVSPDVAVVDLGLPDLDGIELIGMLRERRPELPIVVLTVATSEARILAAIKAGAAGYLFKEDLDRRLASAIVDAFEGGSPMSPAVAQLVLRKIRTPEAPEVADNSVLTTRERAVLDGIARGFTYDEVGARLDISINTVRSHVRSVYDKLDASTKAEAIMTALRRGLLLE